MSKPSLAQAVEALQEERDQLAAENVRLKAQRFWRTPQPGDVWFYAKNHRLRFNKNSWLKTVKSVNRSKNRVDFESGWNPLDNMENDPDWVLVGRVYRDGDEEKVVAAMAAKDKKSRSRD